jgi:hypothetical protein
MPSVRRSNTVSRIQYAFPIPSPPSIIYGASMCVCTRVPVCVRAHAHVHMLVLVRESSYRMDSLMIRIFPAFLC